MLCVQTETITSDEIHEDHLSHIYAAKINIELTYLVLY